MPLAARSPALSPVVLVDPLVSYESPRGYGKAYVYGGDNRQIGGLGSSTWYVPGIVRAGDIMHFLALLAPRSLAVLRPRWADGRARDATEPEACLPWTRGVYRLRGAEPDLAVAPHTTPDEVVAFLRTHAACLPERSGQ